MSRLKDIKDYFVTALAAINGTGGYVNTISTINQKTVNKLASVETGAAQVFVQVKSKKESGPSTGVYRIRTATVEIIGQIINPTDAENNDAAIFSLDADIEKVIGVDGHCGGVAMGCKPTGTTFNYGEPEVQLIATVEVQYSDNVRP